MKRKEKIISEMHSGLEFLMKKNKILVINGLASFIDKNTVNIKFKISIQMFQIGLEPTTPRFSALCSAN